MLMKSYITLIKLLIKEKRQDHTFMGNWITIAQ
jgi:hypothetical protein